MKIKKEILLSILIVLLIPSILSLEVLLYKDSYLPRETLQSEIHGNFVSLNLENMFIYKGDKVHSEPVIQGILKQNNTYYYYAILPADEGNYSLRIIDSTYIESGETKSDPIIKNFTIVKTNASSLSISPGFIRADKDFEIKVKALNKEQTIDVTFENVSKSTYFPEEDEKTLEFSISGIPTKNSGVKIGDYLIPVFIINPINSSDLLSQLYFSTDSIYETVFPNKTYFFSLYLENTGEKNLTNINLSSDFGALINPKNISNITVGKKYPINFTILTPSATSGNLTGEIVASYDNKSVSVSVSLKLTANENETTHQNTTSTDMLSCTSIGAICLVDEDCSGQLSPSLEGACCIGQCIKKKTSSSNWIYGVLLLIVLAGLGAYIFLQYKKRQNLKPKSIDELMREKVDLKKLKESKEKMPMPKRGIREDDF